MFFTYFVVSFLMSSITVAIIMLIRKIFYKQLSAKWKYNLWFLLLIILTVPFIPNHFIDIGNHFTWDIVQNSRLSSSTAFTNEHVFSEENWMQDFTLAVTRFDMASLNEIVIGIWIIGMFVMTALTIKAWLQLKRIKESVSSLKNQEILSLFEQCKKRLTISNHLIIGESPLITSPLTFGLFKTYVVLPVHIDEWLSLDEIKYIFLHELNHYIYKDVQTNYLIVLYQILY